MSKSIYQLINEALDNNSTGMKIQFTGYSVLHERHKGHIYHTSPFTHYMVTHPNGERQHVSIDHDAENLIIHKKDPNRTNGVARGSLPIEDKRPPENEQTEEDIAMIRNAITPKTKVRRIK